MTTQQPDAGAWASWTADLADRVTTLADGEALVVTAPEGAQRPVRLRAARFGGFVSARHVFVAPWVRLERVEDLLRGHCVGGHVVGGSFPFSPEEDADLLALGWHRPSSAEGEDYLRFWPDDVPQGPFLPRDEARRAAAAVTATFREVLLGPDAVGLPTVGTG